MHRFRLLVALLAIAGLLTVPVARGASSGVVISQVYGGGGNSGAAFANDFVELFNRGSSPVDLSGWSLQYASAASTSWQVAALAGTIQPGHYYLVALASGGTSGAALPAADATGTANLAASDGKVAVVQNATALTCGASAGSCASAAGLVDLVGYGSAADYEGSGAAPAPSSTTAAVRTGSGCTDTDSNADDFSSLAPEPRNGSSPAASCGSEPPPSGGGAASQAAAVDVDVQSVLSLSLERQAISFGTVSAGDTPAPISERVDVVSNNATGYALTVHRSAFAPQDLPLGLSATAPSGGTLGGGLGGGAIVPVPIAPAADLTIGTTAGPSAAGGDAWATNVGFAAPIPVVRAGRYTTTLTYTLVGR
ncbi:MAG TPA: lamin tail domain-containing protein [Gaiellaceae bacterium]|nr:lamin tail domain-containing protein [Gaiellaceae bacterium]